MHNNRNNNQARIPAGHPVPTMAGFGQRSARAQYPVQYPVQRQATRTPAVQTTETNSATGIDPSLIHGVSPEMFVYHNFDSNMQAFGTMPDVTDNDYTQSTPPENDQVRGHRADSNVQVWARLPIGECQRYSWYPSSILPNVNIG